MKIATFNANGIRARLEIVLAWLREESPDVLCVQETKVQDPDFPQQAFVDAGYTCAFRGQKSYNGVAILSRSVLTNVEYGFDDGDAAEEPRLIRATIRGVSIVNTYIPQGYAPDSEKFQYKLKWFERLGVLFARKYHPDDLLVWVGDFNVAPEPVDVYDPEGFAEHVCFHPDVRAGLEKVKAWGFVDVFRLHNTSADQYSFWDYRIPNALKRKLGWRLDHIWSTGPLFNVLTSIRIDTAPRLKPKPSDHTFVVADFQV